MRWIALIALLGCWTTSAEARTGNDRGPNDMIPPAMREPTVANLHGRRGFAVKAAVLRDELPGLVGDLEVLHHDEEWRPNGRHEAHLLAQPRN